MKINKHIMKNDYKDFKKATKAYQKDCLFSIGMMDALKQRNHALVGQIITVKDENKQLSKSARDDKRLAHKADIQRTKALAKLKSMRAKYDTKLKETNEDIKAIRKELK